MHAKVQIKTLHKHECIKTHSFLSSFHVYQKPVFVVEGFLFVHDCCTENLMLTLENFFRMRIWFL